MPLITPIDPSLSDPSMLANFAAKWNLPLDLSSNGLEEVQEIYSVLPNSDLAHYPISMIDCRHFEGKIWRSVFVATNASASAGISITTWGKDHKVKGQTQVKRVSEAEWYQVVKSKTDKGYAAINYIGRDVAVKVGQEFVKDLATNTDVNSIPLLALEKHSAVAAYAKGGNHNIGKLSAVMMLACAPIMNIIRRAVDKGHPVLAEIQTVAAMFGHEGKTSERDVTDAIAEILATKINDAEYFHKPTIGPQIDREEVYGSGWGAFG